MKNGLERFTLSHWDFPHLSLGTVAGTTEHKLWPLSGVTTIASFVKSNKTDCSILSIYYMYGKKSSKALIQADKHVLPKFTKQSIVNAIDWRTRALEPMEAPRT